MLVEVLPFLFISVGQCVSKGNNGDTALTSTRIRFDADSRKEGFGSTPPEGPLL